MTTNETKMIVVFVDNCTKWQGFLPISNAAVGRYHRRHRRRCFGDANTRKKQLLIMNIFHFCRSSGVFWLLLLSFPTFCSFVYHLPVCSGVYLYEISLLKFA